MRKISFALILFLPLLLSGYTIINGNVSGMNLTNQTYYAEDDIYVNAGHQLTVQQGAVIKFAHGSGLTVNGHIDVNGSSNNYAIFTSVDDNTVGETITQSDGNANPGDWKGIMINGYSSSEGIGEFNYARIRYGGQSQYTNIRFSYCQQAEFLNSISELSSGSGLKADDCEIDINFSSFNNNNGYAVDLDDITIKPYNSNAASGNSINAIAMNGTISSDMTWTTNLITTFNDDVNINSDVTLTIPAGTIFKSTSGGNLNVRGTLIANGTVANPIVFTSLKDDTYGGDTNNDGSTTTPSPGNWDCINFYGYSDDIGSGTLNNCIFRYGGDYSLHSMLYFYNAENSSINNCIVDYSYYYGIYSIRSDLQINNTSFSNNRDFPIEIDNGTIYPYSGLSFSNNGTDALLIKGTIESDMTWPSDIITDLSGTLTVADDITLTLTAGTKFKSFSSGKLWVDGTLNANGTASNPIVFTSRYDDTIGGDTNNDSDATSPAPGNWGCLSVNGNGDLEGISNLNHCVFRYGGDYSSQAMIYYYSSGASTISNCTIENSSYSGIHSYGSDVQIDNSTFNNNNNYPVRIDGGTIYEYTGNIFNSNGINALAVEGTITNSLTWPSDIVTCLTNRLTINDDVTLTLTEGTIFKALGGVNMEVYGTLTSVGTQSNPIVFTSLYDDTYGGDTNSDGNATSPSPGNLGAIWFNSYGDNDGAGQLENCIIRYGGSYSYQSMIYFSNGSQSSVENCRIEYSNYSGIKAYESDVQINNNTFSNNNGHPVLIDGGEIYAYSGNIFNDNGINALGVEGTITSDLIWVDDIVTNITGNFYINDNVVLTLTEGTVFKINSNANFEVNGTLAANGTQSNPVVFTSLKDDTYGGDTNGDGSASTPVPGDWQSIFFNGNGDNEGAGQFSNCVIRYGGSYNVSSMLYFTSGSQSTVENSRIEYSNYSGIRSYESDVQINNNIFTDNDIYPIWIDGGVFYAYSGNTFTGNGINALGVEGDITSDLTWPSDVVTNIIGNFYINDDAVLTLTEGTVFKINSSANFEVNGTLTANGTQSNPVVFTSIKDDNYGGDTNSDGTSSIPAPGDWQCLYFTGDGNNDGVGQFNNCVIRYGGYYNYNAMVYFANDSQSTVENSRIEYSNYSGVRSYGSDVQINNNTFENNNLYPILIDDGIFYTYTGNTLINNGIDALGIEGTVSNDLTWTSDLVTNLTGTLYVNDNVTLTIPNGSIFKSSANGALEVSGSLIIAGTETDSVVFTSIHDDNYGGDTKHDGNAVSEDQWEWKGIAFYSGSDNAAAIDMSHTILRYGGSYTSAGSAELYITADVTGSIDNSEISYSNSKGINFNNSSVTLRNCAVKSNTSYGIEINGSITPDLGQTQSNPGLNTLTNNNSDGFQMRNNSANQVNAVFNKWDYNTAQLIDDHIYDNDENQNYGEVIFDPWFEEIVEITFLTEDSLDAGIVYYGSSDTLECRFRNTGSVNLNITEITLTDSTDSVFELLNSSPIILAPGQTETVSIVVTPDGENDYTGTLRITNDSTNRPVADISLHAAGQYDTIPAPQNLSFELNSGNAVISWNEVTKTTHNIDVDIDFYVINYSETVETDPDSYYHLTIVRDTTFTHNGAAAFAPQMFYQVIAIKDFEGIYNYLNDINSEGRETITWGEFKRRLLSQSIQETEK